MVSEQPGDPGTNSGARRHLVIADSVRDRGGAERFVLDAARGLQERGWQVTVLAYRGAPLALQAKARGLAVHEVRTRANGAPWTVLPLMSWLRRQGVDVLLTVYDKDLRTVGLAAHLLDRLGIGGPVVIHSRECDGRIKDRPWIRWFHRRVARRILVNSDSTRRSALASAPWLPPSSLLLLPKGVDTRQFDRCLECPPGAEPRLRLGFLGQLNARKRVDHLVRALVEVAGPWSLRVAGDGPERARLQAMAVDTGLDDRIIFDGHVDDVPTWLTGIDALVLPSLEEGWGYAVAEAAAAGRCVIAFRSSSVPEVTPESAGAILIDPAAAQGLSRAIGALLAEGPGGWRARGHRLREHAEKELHADSMLESLDSILRAAAPGNRT